MIPFARAAREAGAGAADALVPEAWERSQAVYPGDPPPFLQDASIADAGALMRWSADLDAAVRAAAGRFRASPALCRLVWHAHRVLAEAPRKFKGDWVLPGLGEDAGLFPLLVLLGGLPAFREGCRRRGIPDEVVRDTLSDIELWAKAYRARRGAWGLAELGWLRFHLGGTLFRLGRLQFLPAVFPKYAHVFRSRRDGRVTILLPDGEPYGAVGMSDWAKKDPGGWVSAYAREDAGARGHPVTEDGAAVREPIELSAAEWEEVLAPGDPVLEIHVPAGEPLAEDACRASVVRAAEFYPRHLPEHPFRAITCWAWLLDPAFQRILPPEANIVLFQRAFHLYPVPGNVEHVMERVFGDKRPDLTHAPRGGTLRTAVREYLGRGGAFAGDGGGVLRGSFRV